MSSLLSVVPFLVLALQARPMLTLASQIRDVIGEAETRHLYGMAMHSMARLNRNAAGLGT